MIVDEKRIAMIQNIVEQLITGNLNVEIETSENNDDIDKILSSLSELAAVLKNFAAYMQNQINEIEGRMNTDIAELKNHLIKILENVMDRNQAAKLIEKINNNFTLN